jgi:CRP/FNR family transcriptional regulator
MVDKRKLGTIELFEGLDERLLERLANIAVDKRYDKGETIFSAGEEATGFYAVRTGKVRIYKTNPAGKEHVLHIFGPGQSIGEVAVFQGGKFPAHAQTLEESRIVFIPRREFESLIARTPELAMSMLAVLSLRMRGFVTKIEELSLKEVPARLASHLMLLRATAGSDELTLDIPKGQLASYLGTIPETLSRALKGLAKDGVIAVEGSRITILDADRLADMAEGGG